MHNIYFETIINFFQSYQLVSVGSTNKEKQIPTGFNKKEKQYLILHLGIGREDFVSLLKTGIMGLSTASILIIFMCTFLI